MKKKSIIITTGDPAGCGPSITIDAVNALGVGFADFIIVGDRKIINSIRGYRNIKHKVSFIDANSAGIERLKVGYPSVLSGKASIKYLQIALGLFDIYKAKCLVTAPLSKEAVRLSFPAFRGHSEFLADYFNHRIEMVMVSRRVKTVLFTRHTALNAVSDLIKEKPLIETFSLVFNSMKKMFRIKNPKIAIASFNPHAGVNTFLGKEEKAIRKAIRTFGGKIYGPYPADTLFVENNLKKYDCVIALYHDQGMIPFKMLSIKDGVNLTIGLPVIRTSPAHGVAFDIIRENKKPFSSSMIEAIKLANKLDPFLA